MNRQELLQVLRQRFSEEIISVFEKSSKRVYIHIQPDAIVRLAQYLFKEIPARFIIASGVDGRNQMEILYHFTVEDIDLVISLRVTLPKTKLEIASLTSVFTAAHWIEREIHELLGINFVGHPKLKRLLLPEDWPEGVYPLRKDYQEWDPTAIRDRGV
jgi:NADH:ubiquinone oxidoreductase subunit C